VEGRQCRICLQDDSPPALIAPCRCRGSALFVHRDCLDNWRATKKDGRAFTHCSVCQFEYVVEPMAQGAEAQREEDERKCRFRLFVARDTIGMFLVVQVMIILLGFFVRACDTRGQVRDLFPTAVSDHEKTTYYICGFVLFFAIIGLLGLCTVCVADSGRHDPCYGCYGCYIGDCRGCSGGGSDDGKACLIILVVMIVVLAFIGIFIGIFLATIFFQRIVQRHMKVLWLKQETKKYIVRDFYGRELPREEDRPATGPAISMSPIMPASTDLSRVALIPSAPDADSSFHPGKSYPKGLYDEA